MALSDDEQKQIEIYLLEMYRPCLKEEFEIVVDRENLLFMLDVVKDGEKKLKEMGRDV